MQRIQGYHAYVYFDAQTLGQARTLCEEAATLLPVTLDGFYQCSQVSDIFVSRLQSS